MPSTSRTSTGSATSTTSVTQLQGGWKEVKDEVTGDCYYSLGNDVRWEKPAEVEEGGGVMYDSPYKSPYKHDDDENNYLSDILGEDEGDGAEGSVVPGPPPVTPQQEARLGLGLELDLGDKEEEQEEEEEEEKEIG